MNTFDALQEVFVETFLETHPQTASYIGLTTYDTEMPSGTLTNRKKEIDQNKHFLKQFEDSNELLDFDRKMTRQLAIHKLGLSIFIDESLEFYLKNPTVVNGISIALNSLLDRKGADRFSPILARLEKTPQYITDFRTRVVKPARLWTQMAIEGAEGLIRFLPQIIEAARKEIPSKDVEEIENQAKTVEKSLKDYITFLKGVLPNAVTPWPIGRELYEQLLQLRKLPYTSDEILALGRKWLKKEKERLQTLAESIAPGKSLQKVSNMIKEKHPLTFEGILQLNREYLKKARQFVIDNDLVTLPEGEKMRVDEAPEYVRHWLPLGAYFPPPVMGEERIGYFRVTRPQDPAVLKEHNESFIAHAAVHEGYPGHHIQLWCSTVHPHKLRWFSPLDDVDAKFVCDGPELIEGWAVYCEELMREKGFNTAKEYLFTQSQFVLWRAVRIIVDVQLSRGEMTFEDAVTFMERELGMERSAAVGEVRWFSLRPSYPLSYLLGKHMVKNLKKKVKKMMGSAYTDKFFHNTLLYEGNMPLTFFEKVFNHKLKNMKGI